MPLLFQWHWRLEDRPLSPNMIRQLINDTLASTELTGASGAPLRVTPHDFRRLFITDAEMSDVAADASFSGRRERFLAGA
jgi:hypothetical protein